MPQQQMFINIQSTNDIKRLNITQSDKIIYPEQLNVLELTNISVQTNQKCNDLVLKGSNDDIIIARLVDTELCSFLYRHDKYSIIKRYNDNISPNFDFKNTIKHQDRSGLIQYKQVTQNQYNLDGIVSIKDSIDLSTYLQNINLQLNLLQSYSDITKLQDITVINSSDIVLGNQSQGISIHDSTNIRVDDNCCSESGNIIINSSNDIHIGNNCANYGLIYIKDNCQNIYIQEQCSNSGQIIINSNCGSLGGQIIIQDQCANQGQILIGNSCATNGGKILIGKQLQLVKIQNGTTTNPNSILNICYDQYNFDQQIILQKSQQNLQIINDLQIQRYKFLYLINTKDYYNHIKKIHQNNIINLQQVQNYIAPVIDLQNPDQIPNMFDTDQYENVKILLN